MLGEIGRLFIGDMNENNDDDDDDASIFLWHKIIFTAVQTNVF